MLPKQKEVEIPLLEVLAELGGEGEPKKIYPLVTRQFPGLTKEDLTETVKSGPNRWINIIQWVRNTLINKGELDGSFHGIWKITEKGRRRLGESDVTASPEESDSYANRQELFRHRIRESSTVVSSIKENITTQEQILLPKELLELYEEYERKFCEGLLKNLQSLNPYNFEHFAKKLLMAYGFEKMEVTQVSRDGGIDGFGKLKVGLTYLDVAFQCKKWQGNIGRPEIQKFRGACGGDYQQGIFLTTSDFSAEAREESNRKSVVPIILINGEAIVNLMIEKGFGVERISLYKYIMKSEDYTSER